MGTGLKAGTGLARCGAAGLGEVWRGSAWSGMVRQGEAGQGKVRPGMVWSGEVRCGEAGQGMTEAKGDPIIIRSTTVSAFEGRP